MNNFFMENLREKFHEKHQVCLSIWKNVDMLCHNRHGNKISMSKKKVGNNQSHLEEGRKKLFSQSESPTWRFWDRLVFTFSIIETPTVTRLIVKECYKANSTKCLEIWITYPAFLGLKSQSKVPRGIHKLRKQEFANFMNPLPLRKQVYCISLCSSIDIWQTPSPMLVYVVCVWPN